MIEVETSTVIPRPLEVVFAYVADVENWPRWQATLADVQRTNPGPNGTEVGSQYHYVAEAQGQRFPAVLTITQYRPGQEIAFESDWAGPLQPNGRLHFEPVPGGTKVTVRMQPRTRGMLRWIEPRLARALQKANEKGLNQLKALLLETDDHP